ncbi:L-threonylcarbamoyladenylate synthase [Neptunicella sp. SCSIO 80796]|uniref:L-threonylcarbamoyladenylate synthase n=1 Tax=Neptunicella plasticusilytica TaxID=3117012 RepID=UPI003A4E3E2B
MSEQLSLTGIFNSGGLIAYPTEAVFGLGCDPDNQQALENLLKIKNRPADKGLILVAADYGQLLPYVNDKLIPQDKRFEIFSKWPGPVTWLLPKSERVSSLLSGSSDKIAVRVPAFEPVRELCRSLGKPIVSTSANLSGQVPAITAQQVRDQFKNAVNFVLDQSVGGNKQPSRIYDALSGQQLR